jgi:hypothetical protein
LLFLRDTDPEVHHQVRATPKGVETGDEQRRDLELDVGDAVYVSLAGLLSGPGRRGALDLPDLGGCQIVDLVAERLGYLLWPDEPPRVSGRPRPGVGGGGGGGVPPVWGFGASAIA